MAVVELHAKHGIGKGFQYRSLDFNNVFLRHEPLSFPLTCHHAILYSRLSTSAGPSGWIAIVCSKWADKLPSTVTAVQRSSITRTAEPPMFTIGSIARTIPGCKRGPCPGRP